MLFLNVAGHFKTFVICFVIEKNFVWRRADYECWFFACGMLSFIFILLAIIFAILKSKASVLISGFNSKSKEERSLYDEEKMCRDQRNAFLIWAAILGIGALFSYLFFADKASFS